MAVSPVTLIINAVDKASNVIKGIVTNTSGLGGVVGQLSFAYNNVTQSISSLAAQGQKAYQALIGQNVELQQQLLATQSSLAATNKVIQDGVQIKDPTAAIKALGDPVKQAIADLRRGSLELVGVTSKELVPLFQIVAQQSANIGASLQQSSGLALSFAAALGTLGIPLFQARQEINSILTGQITSDSQLAKSLNLNNQMVAQWKAQGVLVERLNEKLAAFKAGNALAANTIEGVSSNIQEIFDEITRVAGEPLLQPIITQLNVLYNFLRDNKEEIQVIAQTVVNFFLGVGTKLGEAVATLQPVFKTLSESLFNQVSTEAGAAAEVITILVDAFVNLVKVSAPILQVVANIALLFTQITASPLGKIIIEAGLIVALLGTLAPAISTIGIGFISVVSSVVLFAGSVAAAGGGVGGLIAVLTASIPSLGAFAVAATAAIAPLLPIIALGGAIAVTLIVKQTGDLRVANEELEEFRQQNDLLSDESIKLATKLKSLNDAERENGKLTDEQAKKRAALQQIAKSQVAALQEQIAAIKQLNPASEEQKRNQESQIAQLQRMIDLVGKQSGGTKLNAQDLQNLGNSYQQLAKKINDAENQIKSGGGGDPQRFKAAADEVVKLTKQQTELGQEEANVAIARLERIRNDSRVEFGTQLAAQDAITKIRQGEVNKRVKAAEVEQQRIQAQVSAQQVSQVEGDRLVTESKVKQTQLQLQATKDALTQEQALRQQQVETQIKDFDKQIAEVEKRRAAALGKDDKGGVRLANEELKQLEAKKNSAQESLKIDSQRITELKSQQQKFTTDIAQLEGQQRDKKRQEELKDFDERQSLLDAQFTRRLISEQQFNAQSLQLTRQRTQAELRQIQEQRAKLAPTDKEGLEALSAREAVAQKKLVDATEKFEAQRGQIRINAANQQQQILDTEFSAQLISTQEFNTKSLELTRQRTEAELAEVERQRKRLPTSDTEGRLALSSKEAEARKRLVEATEKVEVDKSKARIANLTSEQAQVEAKLQEGNITQKEYATRSLSITQQKLQTELDEVKRQRARLKTDDKQKLSELAAQEAEIRKKQVEALESFQQQQLQILERSQKKATDLVQFSEEQRLTEIVKLEAARTIRKEEAEKLRLDVTRDRINEELRLEQEKIAALIALPQPSDPRKAEERESQIRASKLKTAQLTKSLIDNEIQQQDALYRVVESQLNRQTQAAQNAATAQTQALNRETQLTETLNKSLENQVKLFQIRKELIASAENFYTTELNILKETTKSESEKQQIAETTAEIRLKSVRAQAQIEAEILALNLEQKASALEQEKIQLRIQQIQARAATLQAQADLKKVEGKRDATPEEREAARLKVEAAIASETGLQAKDLLLGQQEELNKRDAERQRQAQRNTAQLEDDKARLELANTRVDKGKGEEEQRQLRSDISKRLGFKEQPDSEQIRTFGQNLRFLPRIDNQPLQEDAVRTQLAQIEAQLRQQLNLSLPSLPQSQQPQLQIPIIQNTRSPIQGSTQSASPQITTPVQKVGDVNITITNQFTNGDIDNTKAAQKQTQQIRKELYDLGVLLTR